MQGTGREIQKRDENGLRIMNYAKGEFEVAETANDLNAVLNDGVRTIQALRARGGRPAVYPPTKEGLDAFLENCSEYFRKINAINENPDLEKLVVPDIEGLCVHLGITRQTLHIYGTTRGDDWREGIALVKTCVASAKKQLAHTFRTPPTFAIFDFTNNHAYFNTSEFRLHMDDTPRRIEETSLENKLEAQGLVWDEERQEFVPDPDGH